MSRFLPLFLALLSLPGNAQPTVELGPERPITELTFDAAAGFEEQPSVATNGDSFAAVWVNSRATSGNQVIRLARITAAGEVLDPFGVVGAERSQPILRTEIFWTEGHYTAVWVAGQSFQNYEVWAVRFSVWGELLDATPKRLSDQPLTTPPAIASNGQRLLVAAAGTRAFLWSADLTTVQSIVLPRAAADGRVAAAGAGFNGREFLLVWAEATPDGMSRFWSKRIDQDGQSAGPVQFVAIARADDATIEVGQNNFGYVVAWSAGHTAFADFTLLNGESTSVPPFPLADANAVGNVVWVGDAFLIPAWSLNPPYRLSVVRLRTTILMNSVTVATGPNPQAHGSIAWNGSRGLVVWTDRRREHPDVYGAFVDRSGEVIPLSSGAREFALTYSPPEQQAGDIASDGEKYLAVWSQPAGFESRVFFGLVSATGEPLGPPTPMPPSAPRQMEPAVAFNGEHFVAIWLDKPLFRFDGDPAPLVGARISRDGRLLDQQPFLVSNDVAPGDYAIASDGQESLVAFNRLGFFRGSIHLAKITRNRLVKEVGTVPLTRGAITESSPSLAFGGGNYLVVWNDRMPVEFICQITCPPINDPNVMAVRVHPDGRILDDPIAIATSNKVLELRPKAAWSGSTFLVIWGVFEGFFGGEGGPTERATVSGVRIGPNGTLIDRDPITIVGPTPADGPGSQWAVAHDGVTFVVGAGLVRLEGSDRWHRPLVAARVNDHGRVLDTPSGLLVNAEADLGAIASRGGGESLIAYDRFITGPWVGTNRLFGRVIRQPESGRRRPVAR